MAEWIPPKTNWPVEDIPGVGDFNRIEGNTQYLKDYCLFWYEPSDEILLESLSQKTVSSESYVPMKTFRLTYPGRYKITFEACRASTEWPVVYANIRVWGQSTGNLTTSWKPFTFTYLISTVHTTFNIEGQGQQLMQLGLDLVHAPLAVYIRNVRIYGSPVRMLPPIFTLN